MRRTKSHQIGNNWIAQLLILCLFWAKYFRSHNLQNFQVTSSLHSTLERNGLSPCSCRWLRMRSWLALKIPTGIIRRAMSSLIFPGTQWDFHQIPYWCSPLGLEQKSPPKSLSSRNSQHFPPLYWTRGVECFQPIQIFFHISSRHSGQPSRAKW